MPFATIHNARMFYRLQGNSGRPVLILSHSISTDHAMWDLQVENLLPYFQILRYDTRGHGASDVTAGEYTIEILGQDALALADALEIPAICLLRPVAGWSDRTVDRRAMLLDRVTHLVLANTSPQFVPRTNWDARIASSAQRRNVRGRRRGHAAILLTRYPGQTKSASRFDPLSIRGHRSRRLSRMLCGPA